MKQIKTVTALVVILALVFSLSACGGGYGELRAAERALKDSPYRVTTKTVFRSEDAECALLLSGLGGTDLPLAVDGDRIMASAMTEDGYRLTMRVIDGCLYYNAVSTTGELKLLVVLNREQERKLRDEYSSGDKLTYSDFKSVAKSDGQGDEVYTLEGVDSDTTEMLEKNLGDGLASVYKGGLKITGVKMVCRLNGGKFKYVTTSVDFELSISGATKYATMVVEESYVYSSGYAVRVPEDEYLYEEISYGELFGN